MAAFPNSAPAPEFHPFIITGKAGDFPASQAARLAMLAAVIKQAAGGSNGC